MSVESGLSRQGLRRLRGRRAAVRTSYLVGSVRVEKGMYKYSREGCDKVPVWASRR